MIGTDWRFLARNVTICHILSAANRLKVLKRLTSVPFCARDWDILRRFRAGKGTRSMPGRTGNSGIWGGAKTGPARSLEQAVSLPE